ncbi:hypothetical protein C5Q96_04655 [Mogibacterium diversum]|uniref:Uncharacterized protein n=1 Tax=Mogibacterium diversum TaxID=114527 RepID=A0A2S0L4F8_9FIRM|nr:hypothetical protein [Mogibacterium diversum]AVM48170.1 hypothetical protein C5Q96_04655 [Mogibacterium diversum]
MKDKRIPNKPQSNNNNNQDNLFVDSKSSDSHNENSFKNTLQTLSRDKIFVILGVIAGAILCIIGIISLITMKTLYNITLNNYSDKLTLINTLMKLIPWLYYLALITGIISLIVSILNAIHYKDLKVITYSVISVISCLLMLMNYKYMNGMRIIMSSDPNDFISGKLSVGNLEAASSFLDSENIIPIKFKLMILLGVISSIYAVYLLAMFSKYGQNIYMNVSMDAFKGTASITKFDYRRSKINDNQVQNDSTNIIATEHFNEIESENEHKDSDLTDNNLNDPINTTEVVNVVNNNKRVLTKKRIILISIIVIIFAVAGGGYYIWNTFFNFTKIDLSSNIELTIDGISGNAYISDIKNDIKYDKNDAQISEFISNLNYDYSKSNKIKNGDEITVNVVYDKKKAKKLKLKITKSSKKIKVKKLNYRFDSASDISTEIVQLVKSKGESELNKFYSNDPYYSYNFSYYGTYFLKLEDSDVLVAVFKEYHVERDGEGGIDETTHFYIYGIKNVDSALNKDNIDNDTYVKYREMLDKAGVYVTNESDIVPALSTWYREPVKSVTKVK